MLDADALNLLTERPLRRDDWVLTPHPAEAARLLGVTTAEVQADRYAAAAALQARYGGVVVLKGPGTVVQGSGTRPPAVCTDGNPGMASGGMGDVLTGVIAGLVAQGYVPEDAAEMGVCVHGAAGDRAAEDGGERGMLASDLYGPLRCALLNPGERWSSLDVPSAEAQEALGRCLAACCPGPFVVFLEGDLGAGKTTLVRGFLRGLGHAGAVKSPTFTLIEPYELACGTGVSSRPVPAGHAEELEYLGLRDLLGEHSVLLVEWPARGEGSLPPADLRIDIEHRDRGRWLRLEGLSERGRRAARTAADAFSYGFPRSWTILTKFLEKRRAACYFF